VFKSEQHVFSACDSITIPLSIFVEKETTIEAHRQAGIMSLAIWIAVGLAISALVAAAVVAREGRQGGRTSLGAVSEQWVAEQRANQSGDHP
jgi:hypothetical protein